MLLLLPLLLLAALIRSDNPSGQWSHKCWYAVAVVVAVAAAVQWVWLLAVIISRSLSLRFFSSVICIVCWLILRVLLSLSRPQPNCCCFVVIFFFILRVSSENSLHCANADLVVVVKY